MDDRRNIFSDNAPNDRLPGLDKNEPAFTLDYTVIARESYEEEITSKPNTDNTESTPKKPNWKETLAAIFGSKQHPDQHWLQYTIDQEKRRTKLAISIIDNIKEVENHLAVVAPADPEHYKALIDYYVSSSIMQVIKFGGEN